MWTALWLLVFLASAALVLVSFRLLRSHMVRAPRDDEGMSSVSVVLAAHDEAPRIGAAVRSALSQDHPRLELLVVDDRSSDGTAEAARRAAGRDPRVRIFRATERPPGWQGPLHAQALGAEASRGEWLFFLSADQQFTRANTLRAAVAECERRRAKAVALLPRFVGSRWWERLWFHPMINNPVVWGTFLAAGRMGRSAWLVGALTLRRSTYDAMGGARAALECGAGAYDDLGWSRAFTVRGERAEMVFASGLEDGSNWTSFGEFFQGLTRWCAGIFTYRRGGWIAAGALAGLLVATYVALARLASQLAAGSTPEPAGPLALGFALVIGVGYCRWNRRPWWVASVFVLVPLEVLAIFAGAAVAGLRNRAGWRDDNLRIRAAPPPGDAPTPPGVGRNAGARDRSRAHPRLADAPERPSEGAGGAQSRGSSSPRP